MFKKRIAILVSVIISAAAVLAGCASDSGTEIEKTVNSSVSVQASTDVITETSVQTSELFTERDLEQTADTDKAVSIAVSDGQTVDSTEAGGYIISGSAKNCTIKVNADSDAKVQLVLDGVSITNDSFPAIYVLSADKCFITTTDSENSLSVTGSFTSDGDTNTDAVIFSKDDLVFNGTGTLKIESAQGNGISGKDDIKFTGGSYEITSKLDGIEAKDQILISGGSFNISSQKDGLHCENDEDNTLGIIYISDGTFSISAASDAIQANTSVTVDGGTFELTAAEGIESTYVQINGGSLSITASDDGINAGNKNNSGTTPTVEINGGDIKIVMGQGDTDGVDANGNIIINGGTIDVYTSGSSFDYDGTAEYNGGTILINGSQVDSIPQSMMGGGGPGGMKGNMQGF